MDTSELIREGRAVLGIEFGSTRIKAVLIDDSFKPLASGSHTWENRLMDGIWTYTVDDIWDGLRDCYADLVSDVKQKYGVDLVKTAGIGVSAMMHGYMPFDAEGNLMVPFRTWRNTCTGPAAEELTELFSYHIPQRWSIAHLYQAILNGEEHVPQIRYITTLAGYIHWKLTGEKVLGVGDASGMFPVDPENGYYDAVMLDKFDNLISSRNYDWKIRDILPQPILAGKSAGTLTAEGARLLDPSGALQPGCPMAPPEGDAGTGMTATNSTAVRTGNISAGTSVFSMVVLEKPLSKPHDEIDIVAGPDGMPTAMVHCNNCTSDLNAWVGLFREFAKLQGYEISDDQLYSSLYKYAFSDGDADCGGLLAYNYFSGEGVTHFDEGRPLFVRRPDDKFNLANFIRVNLYTALGALKAGNDILIKEEGVKADFFYGQGGFFKVRGAGDRAMAAALNTEIRMMETAGEGGPWGMAILTKYMLDGDSLKLSDYLNQKVFKDAHTESCSPVQEDVDGFDKFMKDYMAGLAIEKSAIESLKD